MQKFSTKVSSASALSRWIHKAPDSTLPKDKARIAFKCVSHLQQELEPVSNHSAALSKAYMEEVVEFKKQNPDVDVNKTFPAELQIKQAEMSKQQKELNDEMIEVEFSQDQFLALSPAIESILNNMYKVLEKLNGGEKTEEKDVPSIIDYNHIQDFEEDLKKAFAGDEKKSKKE